MLLAGVAVSACPSTSHVCKKHPHEAHCVLQLLDQEDVKFLLEAFSSPSFAAAADKLLLRCEPHCESATCASMNGDYRSECGTCEESAMCNPMATDYMGGRRSTMQRDWKNDDDNEASCHGDEDDACNQPAKVSAEFIDEFDIAMGVSVAEDVSVRRQTLPRAADPRLERIAARLEEVAEYANALHGWGFQLDTGATDGLQSLQLNTYRAGGTCPPHRDALQGAPTLEVPVDLPVDQLPTIVERDPISAKPGAPLESVEYYAHRAIGVIVQLTARIPSHADDEGGRRPHDGEPELSAGADVVLTDPTRQYTGGQLQLRLGTDEEAALAQRLPNGHIVDAIRANATILRAPACPGDAIFFPTLAVHEVLPVTGGTRAALVWWVNGDRPRMGLWAKRSPWDRDLARERPSST